MGELALLQNGVRRGRIQVCDGPVRTCFSVRCPALGPGLYKVWLVGPAGRLLLGTLEPMDGGLGLTRTCSGSALRAAGAYPPERGELLPCWPERLPAPPPGWGGRQSMPVRPEDPELCRTLEQSPPGFYRRTEEGWLLAWPWRPGEEHPVPALACLGWSGQVGERECFLLRLDRKLWPAPGRAE